MVRRASLAIVIPTAGLLALGCRDNGQPVAPNFLVFETPEVEFVRFSSTAPALGTLDTTFWAVRGEDRRLSIRFKGHGGPTTGKWFLRLRTRETTLSARPDGTAFSLGDSIEIRVTLDAVRFLWTFEPAGLEFNPADPAELRIRYDDAESGFLSRELEFDVWRQERPGDPWELIPSEQSVLEQKVEADLLSFTRYALAIGR